MWTFALKFCSPLPKFDLLLGFASLNASTKSFPRQLLYFASILLIKLQKNITLFIPQGLQ